jgi:hypothetical protein
MSGSDGVNVGPDSPVWYFDLSPVRGRYLAQMDDRLKMIPVAEEHRLQRGRCPYLHCVGHWFVSGEQPEKLSWQRLWSHRCAGTPGTRADCDGCPACEASVPS